MPHTPCHQLNYETTEAFYENRLLEIAERVLPGRTLVVYQVRMRGRPTTMKIMRAGRLLTINQNTWV